MSNISQENRRKQTADDFHNVWNAVDELRTDVSSIKSSQASLVAKFDQVFEMFRQINGDRKTPWGIIISAIGVLIVMVTAIGGAALAPLYLSDSHQASKQAEENYDIRARIADIRREAEVADGRSRERQAEVRSELKLLDVTLQREMRDLDKVQIARLESLDRTLQREIGMNQELQDAKRDAINEKLSSNGREHDLLIKPRLDSIDERTRALETKYAERLSALEAALKRDAGQKGE